MMSLRTLVNGGDYHIICELLLYVVLFNLIREAKLLRCFLFAFSRRMKKIGMTMEKS